MAKGLWRTLVVLHRYLGMAVGLLMLMWFGSGIVMMYVGYPELAEQDRLPGLKTSTSQPRAVADRRSALGTSPQVWPGLVKPQGT